MYLQSNANWLINHELGHQLNPASNDHAKGIRNNYNISAFHEYYWDATSSSYKVYAPGVSPYTAIPFSAPSYEYGNPFDTMGNTSHSGNEGQYRVDVKYHDLNTTIQSKKWLTNAQVPNLNSLGEGTYRIYAHDELQYVTDEERELRR